jgi:hypothetical protein
MLKYLFAAAALVLAGVPAVLGLTSNASFSRDVPVRVPEQAQVVAPTPTAAGDDGTADQGPGEVEPSDDLGDDQGDDVARDDRTEAGDDRDGTSGRDDGGSGGDDRSGSNSGGDDSGSGSGGGSDDGSGHS